jgi:predicted GNAT family acetyltransferase
MEIQHLKEGSKGAFLVAEGKEHLAEMTYTMAGTTKMIIDHTEVSEKLSGQGVGKKLVLAAVDYARQNQIKILPLCPFAKSVFGKTPEIRDVLV